MDWIFVGNIACLAGSIFSTVLSFRFTKKTKLITQYANLSFSEEQINIIITKFNELAKINSASKNIIKGTEDSKTYSLLNEILQSLENINKKSNSIELKNIQKILSSDCNFHNYILSNLKQANNNNFFLDINSDEYKVNSKALDNLQIYIKKSKEKIKY